MSVQKKTHTQHDFLPCMNAPVMRSINVKIIKKNNFKINSSVFINDIYEIMVIH